MAFDNVFRQLDERKTLNEKITFLRERAQTYAQELGYRDLEDIDSFRHLYSSAVLGKYYGEWTTRGLGVLNEFNGEGRNLMRRYQGKSTDSTAKMLEDSFKDLYNNEIGITHIARVAQNEEYMIREVTRAINSNEAIRHR